MKMPKSALTGLEEEAGSLSDGDADDPFSKPKNHPSSANQISLPPILAPNPSISTYLSASSQI